MTQATINGNTYSDDGSAAKDMNNGGHRTHFLPLVNDVVAVAGQVAADKATVATDKAVVTADKSASQSAASAASASSIAAQGHANIATTKSNEAAASAVQSAASAVAAAAIVTGVASNRPSIRPSLLLDFANTKQLDPRITFSRPTTATYYDGKTTAMAEQNLWSYSQDFTNAAWVKYSGNVTGNATASPDGTTTASLFVPLAANAQHCVVYTSSGVAGTYSVSLYAKSAGYNYLSLSEWGAGQLGAITVDLSTGTVTQNSSSLSVAATSVGNSWYRITITNKAFASPFAITIGVAGTSTGTGAFGPTAFLADGTSGIYLWGAQLEQRSAVTAYTQTTSSPITNYIPALQTAAANVARFDHDPITGESKGLLIEEQRTNLLTYSDQFNDGSWSKTNVTVDANSGVAPDGTLSADRFVESSGSSSKGFARGGIIITAGTIYTVSVYVKSYGRRYVSLLFDDTATTNGVATMFDLQLGVVSLAAYSFGTGASPSSSITNVGNGWYRLTLTGTAGTASTFCRVLSRIAPSGTDVFVNYTGDGYSGIYIWGAQLEAGSFPTSYIPTVASQVTRSADSASMTGTNFSSWYRADEGTLYNNFSANGRGTTSVWYGSQIDDNSTLNRIRIGINDNSGDVGYGSISASGTAQAEFVSSISFSAGQFANISLAYKANDFAMSVNGNTVQTDSSGSIPFVNRLNIGGGVSGAFNLNGTIKRIAYYPKRLSNTELQAITS